MAPSPGWETPQRIRGRRRRRLLRWFADEAKAWNRAWQVEWARGIAFLSLPLLIGAGAVLYFLLPAEPSPVPMIATAVACASCGFILRERFALQIIAFAILAVLLGAAAAKLETERKATPILGSTISTRVTGRVALVELQDSGRTRLTLDVLETARPILRYAPDRVRVTARHVPADLLPGETVQGLVRLMPPSGPVRPGSYDFAFQSFFNELGAVGFFLRDPERVAHASTPTLHQSLAAQVEQLRMVIAGKIRDVLPGAPGEIAAALIAGVRAGIPEAVNEDLRITGLAHVLSISGLHMALAAATMMGGLRMAFAMFPGFAARHPVKKYAAVAALAGTAFYLLLAGDQVAASRSFLMVAVMLTAILFDRAALSMRNLAIAALIILLVTPHEIMGPSFQMSFAATAALIAGYAAWTQWRQRHGATTRPPASHTRAARIRRFVLTAVAGSIATSILAGGATTIFGAYHFQRVSPLTLISNLVTMPIIGLLIMPPAVMAVIAMPFGLEAIPLEIMGLGLEMMLGIANWLAERSPVDAVGIIPPTAMVSLALAMAIACFTSTRWRLAALPFVFAGAIALISRETPDLYVSEDGRLVGIVTSSGDLAVNRRRPNAFTVQDWQRAASASLLIKPASGFDSREPVAGFSCEENSCVYSHPSGRQVVSLTEGSDIEPFCRSGAVIVIDDATLDTRVCSRPGVLLIGKRELARRGSATIKFDTQNAAPRIRHAINQPYRPWHAYRRFSREARGMPPYKRGSDQRKPPVSISGSNPQADPVP